MLFVILTIIAYLVTILAIVSKLTKTISNKLNTQIILGLGTTSILLHFMTLCHQLSNVTELGLSVINVISFICLFMSLLATFALTKWKTIWLPLLIIYVLSLVTVIFSGFLTGDEAKKLIQNKTLLFHIFIAMLSYALFFIATLYALQLKLIDIKLKNKALSFNSNLPPLLTVERHLFRLTLLAQSLLTIALITGIIYLPQFFSPSQIHKTILSFLAWFIYSLLLFGQWKLHWRGKRVLIYTISGIILLTLGYFGSRV